MGPQLLRLLPAGIMLIFIVLMRRRKMALLRSQQQMIKALEVGAEVMTTSGFYGTIMAITGDIATVEIAPSVHVRIVLGALTRPPASDGPATSSSVSLPSGLDKS
jgi:preprotein translocase subunit YajC